MSSKPVDTAIIMTVGPLIDDSDFKSLEEAIAYNAAGMDISMIVEKTDGTSAVTAIALTTGGTSDWTHKDGGYYEVEITAAQNVEEGIAYLRGVCTGVLPFESPRYEIVPANIYDSLVKGTDKIQTDLTQIGGVVQSLTDFKDMVDTGYDPANHKIQSDLIYIHGTALTETPGQLAAAFKKLFDVATPLLVASDVMRGTDGAALTTTALTNTMWTDAKAGALTDWINGGRLDLLLDGLHSTPHCAQSGTINIGSSTAGSYLDTCVNDSNNWGVTHSGAASDIDFQLEFDIGANRIANWVTLEISSGASGGAFTIYAYNYLINSWDQLNYDSLTNQGITIRDRYEFSLLQDHVNPYYYGDGGEVLIRMVSKGHSIGSGLSIYFCNVHSTDASLATNGKQLSAWGKLDVNAECDTANSDYGANTTVPDAAGTAPTATEIRTEMEGVGTKLTNVLDDVTGIAGDAMRGTDSAALAATALSDATWTDAKAGHLDAAISGRAPASEYDTQIGYIPSDLGSVPIASELNSSHGAGSWATATGFNTVEPDPAGTAPTATEIRTEMEGVGTKLTNVLDDVTGIAGDAMRGTDGANTTVPDIAGTAAGLHTTTDGKVDTIGTNVDMLIDEIGGKWAIAGNQMIFYKSDNITEIMRFNLFDSVGSPTMTNPASRERVP